MSYKVILNNRQLETVEKALYFYEKNLLDMSPYNNLTKRQETTERAVVDNVRTRIRLARFSKEE